MTDEDRRQQFLTAIKSQGRSSPTGKYWADFHALLKRYSSAGEGKDPPVPMILAASGESDRSKHDCLARQLLWAIDHGCFAEAVSFLEGLTDDEQWNIGSADSWDQDYY